MTTTTKLSWTDHQNESTAAGFRVTYYNCRWVASTDAGYIGPMNGYVTREGAKRACEFEARRLGL